MVEGLARERDLTPYCKTVRHLTPCSIAANIRVLARFWVVKYVIWGVDANRGDPQSGWDTDQFPNDYAEATLALYTILKGGGFTTGGFNFDAKIRRQSIDPADLFHAHIGGLDTLAKGLLNVAKMIEDGKLQAELDARYAGWSEGAGKAALAGELSLADIADSVHANNINPVPQSGRQEMLENLVNRYL